MSKVLNVIIIQIHFSRSISSFYNISPLVGCIVSQPKLRVLGIIALIGHSSEINWVSVAKELDKVCVVLILRPAQRVDENAEVTTVQHGKGVELSQVLAGHPNL